MTKESCRQRDRQYGGGGGSTDRTNTALGNNDGITPSCGAARDDNVTWTPEGGKAQGKELGENSEQRSSNAPTRSSTHCAQTWTCFHSSFQHKVQPRFFHTVTRLWIQNVVQDFAQQTQTISEEGQNTVFCSQTAVYQDCVRVSWYYKKQGMKHVWARDSHGLIIYTEHWTLLINVSDKSTQNQFFWQKSSE